MVDEKKFLDQSGVEYLWSQLSLEDYPNNETLIAILDAIDQTKADKDELFSGSWNDLTDKPFGETESWTLITSLEFEGTYTNLNLLDTSVKNIKFVFDGEEYFFDFYGDGTYGGDGYPFEFSAEFSGFAVGYVLYITCGDGFHTVEIYAGETTVKPIDAKYLPDNNYASQEYVDGQLSTKSDSNHEHNELYYTETEVNDLLNGKVNTSELDNYYTKPEVEVFHDEIKDYVDDEVAALVNSAPETLDTLGELAEAFQENKEVVDVLNEAIATKYSSSNPPPYPVTSVQGKTGAVNFTTETWTFTLSNGSTVTKKVLLG